MLVAFMMGIENKKQIQDKEIKQITQSYTQNEQKMEEIYEKALNAN